MTPFNFKFFFRFGAIAIAIVIVFIHLNEKTQSISILKEEAAPWMQDRLPIVLNPDSNTLLYKTERRIGLTEVIIHKIGVGDTFAKIPLTWPLLLSFRPHSSEVSFVQDHGGDRKFGLFFWNTDSVAVEQAIDVELNTADRWTRWSPDGSAIAVILASLKGDKVSVVKRENGNSYGEVVFEGKDIYNVEWSPNGKALCILSLEKRGRIAILDLCTATTQNIDVEIGSRLLDSSWTPDGRKIILSCKGPSESGSRLVEIDVISSAIKVLRWENGHIRSPKAQVDGRIIYEVVYDLGKLLKILDASSNSRSFGLEAGENTLLTFDATQNSAIIKYTSTSRPEELMVVFTDHNRKAERLFSLSPNSASGVPPTSHLIHRANRGSVKVLTWKSPKQPSLGLVLQFPVRRQNYESSPIFNGQTQFILSKGFDVAAFDFLPTPDRSPGWDLKISADDIDDAIHVARFVRGSLGDLKIPLLAYGESNGAMFAAAVACKHPNLFKGLFFHGITRSFEELPPLTKHNMIVGSVHGENDQIDPLTAKRAIERIFGSKTFTRWPNHWRVLRSEGHSIRWAENRAFRAAMVVRTCVDMSSSVPGQLWNN